MTSLNNFSNFGGANESISDIFRVALYYPVGQGRFFVCLYRAQLFIIISVDAYCHIVNNYIVMLVSLLLHNYIIFAIISI